VAEEKPEAPAEIKPEDVEILDEWKIKVSPRLGEVVEHTMVLFRYGDLPPDTVMIPKPDPTDREIWEAIKARVQELMAKKPRRLKV